MRDSGTRARAPGPSISAITGRFARDTRDPCDARDSCYSRVLSGHGESIQRAPAHLGLLLGEEARIDPPSHAFEPQRRAEGPSEDGLPLPIRLLNEASSGA